MSFQGFYTTKGLTLAAKIAAGTKLTITKVTAGSGETAQNTAALAQERQTLTAGAAVVNGQTAVLPVTLAETTVSAAYSLKELGVYAQDPDAGEILFQVFRLDSAITLTAGGENAYRFYLKQTVGAAGITVICSPAGLLLEEDLAPVKALVLPTAVQEQAVNVTAAELQSYLDSLPRLLAVALNLYVTGTVTEPVTVKDFYGGGHLTFCGTAFQKIVRCSDVRVPLKFMGCTFAPSGINQHASALYLSGCRSVELSACTIDGAAADEIYGAVIDNTCVHFNGTDIKNCWIAAQSSACSMTAIKGGSYSGNTYGAGVQFGAVTTMGTGVSETLGGSSNLQQGGLLVGPAGTLL